MLQAPARSTHDHPPRDPTRGRRRTPPASAAKLRLTRRAWLLLWLTVAGIALVDGRLLMERSRILVAVEGRSASVPAGLTVEQALQRLAVPPLAGDLLAVDHTVLRRGAYPPRVLVNGQPASGTRRLRRGDHVTLQAGRDRMEPVVRGLQQLPARRRGNPVRWLSTGPAQAVLNRGSLSGRVVPVSFQSAGGSPAAPLPVALTFDDGPWPQVIADTSVTRSCPLVTEIDRPMWHASGTAGDGDLGLGLVVSDRLGARAPTPCANRCSGETLSSSSVR